ncbi:unnamed protein product [Spirodela intermedia]|uniref:Uncharacterized protein n=1 Tax=Spirodela intermedia TaxID=51605 RepID=A0A7I8JB69_SPIIN|nr:unnamed protein product [Spirodela intermedia]CAA6667329.1 unnamed protein product [Spirodela intermedia]
MFGLSYGEIFLLLGATAALIVIARTAGRLAGRAIGYVQMARGQFDSVMQQSQVSQVHKELQDTIAQLEAIRYEVRSISLLNPGPLTRKLDNTELKPIDGTSYCMFSLYNGPTIEALKVLLKLNCCDHGPFNADSANVHSQAMIYAKFAESTSVKSDDFKSNEDGDKHFDSLGLLSILPVSAESAGLLPKPGDETKGSDIVLEAILEAEVARNAKDFFRQPENQIPNQ